jgi:hypothetical protein
VARLIGGKHPYHIEDDVLCLAVRGVFDREDMAELLTVAEQMLAQHPDLYLLGNLHEMTELTLGARKYTAQWLETHRCAGVSYYGTSFITRAIVILVSRGINLLTKSALPVGISQDEAEARQWIARQRLRSRPSSPGAQ